MEDEIIKQESSKCVKCGICVPSCPTFKLTKLEPESPRGRISLIQGLMLEQLQPSDTLIEHLNNCLQCQACERICPAEVSYNKLIDRAKQLLAEQKPMLFKIPNWLNYLCCKPKLADAIAKLLVLYQISGCRKLLSTIGISKLIPKEQLVPKQKWLHVKPITSTRQVALFMGCISRTVDSYTIKSAVKLLQAAGYQVIMPKQQICCGALHHHNGSYAEKFIKQNLSAFTNHSKIVSIGSGCANFLTDYPAEFANKIIDICDLLVDHKFNFKPLACKVAVHTPCSLQSFQRHQFAASKLLQQIPQLNVTNFKQQACCGASGLHMLQNPEKANKYLRNLIDNEPTDNLDFIATSNIGCAMHFNRYFKSKIKIVHPVKLLSEQLP